MANKDFLYFLTDDDGLSYYVDQNGHVSKTSTPTPNKYTADGWQDASIKYARNKGAAGMFRSFTLPLKFVKDGARILASLFYNKRIQAAINIVITKLNRATGIHEYFYKGAPDLTTFDDGAYGVTVNVMERGLAELYNANKSTTYELPLDVPEGVTINWDGVELFSNTRYLISQSLGFDPNFGGYYAIEHDGPYINIGAALSNSETSYPSLLFNDTTQYRDAGNLNPANNWPGDYLFSATANTLVKNLSLTLKFTLISDGAQLFFWCKNESSNVTRQIQLGSVTVAGNKTITVNGDFSFNENEKVWLVLHINETPTHYCFFNWTAWPSGKLDPDAFLEFIFTYNYRKLPTQVKALRPLYVFQQLINKITDGKYSAKSQFLTDNDNFVITSGDGVRSLSGAVVKTTLTDFIRSFNAWSAAEFGITTDIIPEAIFEDESYFWNSNKLPTLGEVANAHFINSTDYEFNNLVIGWPNQSYNDVNGRNEFNTTSQYSTPVTRLSQSLELTSVYRADSIGAEILRINLDNKKTTDSTSDNDVFIINIEKTSNNGLFNLNRPVFDSIAGVLSPNTIFNVLLSPARCVRAHSAKIRSAMWALEDKYLTFQTANKNDALVTKKGTEVIAENADIQISTLPIAPYYQPVIVTFDTRVDINLKDIIESDPYAQQPFSWMGDIYSGYILEASQVPNLNPKQGWKLLTTASTDLLKRVNKI
jgi:hypothetical protein